MKKYIKLILFLFVFIPFTNVIATDEVIDNFETVIEENINYDKAVNGSSVQMGNNVSVKGSTRGVGITLGNTVKFNGITDYAVIAGNTVDVDGTIANDGLISGNLINFSESFTANRDIFIFGNEITLDGTFDRDVVIYGSKVIINGNIKNNLTIKASNIEIKSTAIVAGVLKYNKDATINNKSDNINQTELSAEFIYKNTFTDTIIMTLHSLAGLLIVYIVLVLVFPSLFEFISNKTQNLKVVDVLSLLGLGALILIVVPIIVILLITLIFGIPLSLLLLTSYIVVIYLSKMFVGYVVGNFIWNKYIKRDRNHLLVGLLGISIIYVILLIPYLGDFVSLFSLLFGIGIVGRLLKKA